MSEGDVTLELQPGLVDEARRAAEAEGMGFDEFVAAALAEKLSAMRTARYFAERGARSDPAQVKDILARAGRGRPPVPGDELPS